MHIAYRIYTYFSVCVYIYLILELFGIHIHTISKYVNKYKITKFKNK